MYVFAMCCLIGFCNSVLRSSKIWTALSYTWDNAGHFIQVRRYRPTLSQTNNEWYVDTCMFSHEPFIPCSTFFVHEPE